MKKIITMAVMGAIGIGPYCSSVGVAQAAGEERQTVEYFPDGTPVDAWFYEEAATAPATAPVYTITDYGVTTDSTIVQTARIQAVIDRAAADGGGVVRVPRGTFLSGSLFFRPGTHLLMDEGAVLKGSDDIADFDIIDTRLEGQSIRYFAALVNAIGCDGFTISGHGTIDGNGLRYWRSFWLRRAVNPQCTNLEEMRPRLVYIAESRDVTLTGVTLRNSPFWTTHIYKCTRARVAGLTIFAPKEPVKAPSSDAVDIDACRYVHITGCDISVNDDALVFKGGKGPDAVADSEAQPAEWQYNDGNGGNEFIILEDCHFGFCHSAMTVGSESLYTRNVIFRRCTMDGARRLLWLKMRPDTPQMYEYIRVEDMSGTAGTMLYIRPWTQFFDLKGGKDYIRSAAHHVELKDIRLTCEQAVDIRTADDQFSLADFTFSNVVVNGETQRFAKGATGVGPYGDMPAADELLHVLTKVNDYYTANHPDPTTPTFVGRERPSNLWTRAVYFEGLSALHAVAPKDEYLRYMYDWGDFHGWKPRNGNTTRNADDYCCGQTYIDLYRLLGEEKMVSNLRQHADMLVDSAGVEDWWWVDALQMGMPYLMKLAAVTGDRRYRDKAMEMYRWTRDTNDGGLFNKTDGLWWRDPDFNAPYTEPNGRNCYWSRGNGWAYAALARVMEETGIDEELRRDFVLMSAAIARCQRNDGFWNCSLHDETHYGGPETSGTALFVYGMAWGVRQGLLEGDTYLPVLLRAWNAIATHAIHDDGFIGYVQGTGKQPKDGQPTAYDSQPDFDDFATGCVLLAGTEVYKLTKALR